MPYITINTRPKNYQISFNDILSGFENKYYGQQKDTKDTRTWFVEEINDDLITRIDFVKMYQSLKSFNEKYKALISTVDKNQLYKTFKIPKKSGGLRTINAPNEELLRALRELKYIFECDFYASYHSSAFAYIKGRSTIDAVKRHQTNKSRWFLKLDFSKFFPSTTQSFLTNMLCETYPFCAFVKNKDCKKELDEALSLCFLNGGLPQGTPTSPLLTNMMMIPIDYAIAKMCREHVPHLKYTRYADDLLISSEFSFKWEEVQRNVVDILRSFHAPFVLNTTKTRYGSSAGRNWNLGVMLNKDNEITVGHAKKKTLKAMLFQFMTDDSKGSSWSIEDVQYMMGIISYYRMVEGKKIDDIIQTYSAKFNKDVLATAKALLNPC